MILKIWQRYFLREIGKVFFLFLGSFYFLFALIDYTSRTGALLPNNVKVEDLAIYYSLMFFKRIDVMLPFALLLATLRALISFNTHNELVALFGGGVSLRTLMRPFIAAALVCVALVYFSYEVLVPYTWTKMKRIEDSYASSELARKGDRYVHDITLDDGSLVLYQSYDSARSLFFDVYWIRSIDDIYRIKTLFPDAHSTIGRRVDHLVRDNVGGITLAESYDTKLLQDLHFTEEGLTTALRSPEELSLGQLIHRLPKHSRGLTDKEAHILARFYSRILMPWLCLLVVIAPAPFCTKFSRQHPILLIYIFSITGLVTFYLLFNAAFVVGSARVVPPLLAVLVPFILYFGPFSYRYVTALTRT